MKIMRWILGLLISLFFSTAVQANVIVATMYTPIGYASYSTKITYYLDDLIVTNPPYVDAEDMSDLPNEYRHEPELGLASGTDGLKLTRRILGNAADYLADDGVLICEVGNSMVHLMEQYPDVPFTWLEFDNGGDGVFMLTKEQLLAAREHFAIYKD